MEAIVLHKEKEAGRLVKKNQKYISTYSDSYFEDIHCKSISLTLPKSQKTFKSNHLFPFFYNMLPEGVNKKLVCRRFKIDENDFFT